MTDDQWKANVAKMTMPELLAKILEHPSLLTDIYYVDLGDALQARGRKLLKRKGLLR